ncbi:TetR family transcriptional regulator [Tsukamurella sputi]|uniref:TetR family transcriptional regulator n=1 Tax=Tsukamurella sputi TaxID=2591848 RepID=A0A5C5RNP0_9ACTN|nr:TetR/AcrR family transcriptional regulator [Tsukamurella sputi]TWS24290.1 TetR family transcriptional regulator [Tsukamurella sputi]
MTVETTMDVRRREILEAAATLIAERGFHSVRIADIAEMVGSSTGAVHYHFPSKSDVLEAALTYAVDRAFDRQNEAVRQIDSAHERLLKLIDMQLPRLGAPRQEWAIWLQVWAECTVRPELRPVHNVYYQRWHDAIAKTVARGVRQGIYRADVDPERFAYELTSMTDGMAIQVMVNVPGLSVLAMREVLVEFISHSLLVQR